jgi:RNA polymerase sigma factor (sigma-70 family)
MEQRLKLPLRVLDRAIGRARKYAEDVAHLYGHELLEDLQSELVLRAWKAWESFDRDGQQWPHWLRDQLRYGVRDVLREHNADRKKNVKKFRESFAMLSLDALAYERRGIDQSTLPLTVEEVEPSMVMDLTDRMIRDEWVESILQCLLRRERYIVEQHYLHGVEKKDIAASLGISATRLRQIERQAFERIQDLCCPYEG